MALALPAAAADAAPAAIASAQLLRAADAAYAELRRVADVVGAETALEGLGERVARADREIDQLRPPGPPVPGANALARDLDFLGEEVGRRETEARRWDDQIQERAVQLDAAATRVRRLVETWRLTVDSPEIAALPPLLARAVELRDRAAAVEQIVHKRLASVLEVQDRVLALKLKLADLLASVRAVEAARTQELLEVESAPLWRAFGHGRSPLPAAWLRALDLNARACGRYLAAEPGRIAAQLLLLAVLIAAGLAVTRSRRAVLPPPTPAGRAVEVVSAHPVASSVLLGLVATPLLHPSAPTAFTLAVFVAGLPPFFRVVGALAPDWRRPLRWLAALFAVESLVAIVVDVAPAGRVVLLGVELLGLLGCWVGLRRGGWLRVHGEGRWRAAMAAAGAGAAVLLAVSAVANVLGNVTLSELLAAATLGSACGTAVVATGVAVFAGACRAALHLPWTRSFRIVREQEQPIVTRGARIFRSIAIVAWVYQTLRAFRATQGFGDFAREALAVRLKVGAIDVTLGDVFAFAVTLWLAVWLSRALKFVLDEALLPSLDITRGKAAAISTTAKYAVIALGFSFATLAAGMEMTRFTVLAGTLGVGIGFGLQNVVNNFVCGLVLLYEQPVQVGDLIEIGQLSGEVKRIGVRSSTVRTFQGADVIVPNSNFISAEVVNWTRSDRNRRVDISIGVAYGAEPRRVQDLLLETARACPAVATVPDAVALFTKFGDSALQFELRFWTPVDDWVNTASGVRAAINQALVGAGIAIPFPQLDLWVRSAPPSAPKGSAVQSIGRIEPPTLPRR